MTDCERCWIVLQKIQCKTLINVLWLGECLCLRHWKHLYSWERITETIYIPKKCLGNSHFKADVRDIWTIDLGTIGWDFWSVSNQLGKFSMETVISGQWWRSHQSLACNVLRILRFCVMSWERWIRTQYQILFGNDSWNGSKIHYNTEHWTQSTENRWNSSGIFFQDSLHCSSSKKSKSSWAKWATHHNSKDESSSCRCSMTSHGEIKTMSGNVLLIPHLCLYLQKKFQQDVGHSLDLGQKQSGVLLAMKDHKQNGTKSLNLDDQIRRMRDTQFSEQRVRCLEERSKAKELGNYLYTSVPMVIRLKLFFAQSFLSISSISTEQSQICVKSTVSVKQAQRDLLCQSNPTHFWRQQTYW